MCALSDVFLELFCVLQVFSLMVSVAHVSLVSRVKTLKSSKLSSKISCCFVITYLKVDRLLLYIANGAVERGMS